MSEDLNAIRELLNAHLSNIRAEMSRLASNYDSIASTVRAIENNTSVELAKINKDIDGLGRRVQLTENEIGAIKKRVEIGEDVQQDRWGEQKHRNEQADKREKNITVLLLGAIGTFISLAIATVWSILT